MAISRLTNKIKTRRVARTRAKITGTSERPRLTIFRSRAFTYAQLIDDSKSHTLASASSKDGKKDSINKSDAATKVGEAIAEKALKLGIKKAVLDRGSYQYHGRVQKLADAARKKGLQI